MTFAAVLNVTTRVLLTSGTRKRKRETHTLSDVAHGSRRVMGMRSCDSRCLFSGSKGEVCAIEPLLAPPDLREHPITHYSLLAMASLTKVGALPCCRCDL